MKAKFTLFLLLLSMSLMAAPVAEQRARAIARNLLNGRAVTARTVEGLPGCLLFTAADGHGFVILSADDAVLPLLGYSLTEGFELHDGVRLMASAWQQQIDFALSRSVKADEQISRSWYELEHNTFSTTAAMQPLLATQWSQSPLYNDSCPGGAPAGSVAVATAQIMRYWQHPATGYGSCVTTYDTVDFGATAYDWAYMPARLTASGSSRQKSAVARLLYHAGVAMNARYSTGGTSAYGLSNGDPDQASAENALKNYFRYSYTTHGVVKAEFTDSEWAALLRAELDAGRPVQYSSYNATTGACSVVDGYDAAGLFHFNWGRGGQADGYYAIGAITPAFNGSAVAPLSVDNQAIIGIRPDFAADLSPVNIAVVSNNPAWGTASGSGLYRACADRVSLTATARPGYRLKCWSSGARYTPYIFPAGGQSRTDTAIFEPVRGDTLCYCRNLNRDKLGYTLTSPSGGRITSWAEWGIRLDPTMLRSSARLTSVELRVVNRGMHILRIMEGNDTTPLVELYADSADFQTTGWQSFRLRQPLPVDANRSLWIVLHTDTVPYPMAYSLSRGNSDGAWVNRKGWFVLQSVGSLAWQIKAIFSPTKPKCRLDVITSDPRAGQVAGAGLYDAGQTVTIAATANPGYRFVAWHDGITLNPRPVVLTCDTTFTARFSSTCFITALSADPAQGTAQGSGRYNLLDTARLTATARPGFAFSHWQDLAGLPYRANPLAVVATADNTYTAYFASQLYNILVDVAPDSYGMGTALGSGQYAENEIVTIEAHSAEGCRFDSWTDGNADNPRTIIVTGDAEYYCRFLRPDALPDIAATAEKLYVDGLRLTISLPEPADIAILTPAGCTILLARQSAPLAHYTLPAPGLYIVTVNHHPHKIIAR